MTIRNPYVSVHHGYYISLHQETRITISCLGIGEESSTILITNRANEQDNSTIRIHDTMSFSTLDVRYIRNYWDVRSRYTATADRWLFGATIMRPV